MNILERCKEHSPSDWAKHIILWCIVGLTVIFAVLFVGLVWPYNDVRFESGTSTTLTPVVEQGGQVTLSNPGFCNDNQDTYVERWAELLGADDKPIGSYELFGLQFYNEGSGLKCYRPSISSATLPNYVIGVDGEQGRFRIRQVISYHPNAVRTVYVETYSTPFLVVPTVRKK